MNAPAVQVLFPKRGQFARPGGVVRPVEINGGTLLQLFQAARPLHRTEAARNGCVFDGEAPRGEDSRRRGGGKRVAQLKSSRERHSNAQSPAGSGLADGR